MKKKVFIAVILVNVMAAGVFAQAEFEPDSILNICRRVADYRLSSTINNGWVEGAYFPGVLALYYLTEENEYLNTSIDWGDYHEWAPHGDLYTTNGDNQCCFQTYAECFLLDPQQENEYMIDKAYTNITNMFDNDPLGSRRWGWCDLMFMSPPGIVRLAVAADEPRLLDSNDVYWWNSTDYYLCEDYGLYFRDGGFVDRYYDNGEEIFWSRGNGWVIAGICRILEYLPEDYPTRPQYIEQLQNFAEALLPLQQDDGLWRSDLLYPDRYPNPEASGSAFFLYGMAWGLNNGFLDSAAYEPAVRNAWSSLIECVRDDGALGYVQTPNWQPGSVDPDNDAAYGDGAFLLAGTEIYKMVTDTSGTGINKTAKTVNNPVALQTKIVSSLCFSGPVEIPEGAVKYMVFDINGRKLFEKRTEAQEDMRNLDIPAKYGDQTYIIKYLYK